MLITSDKNPKIRHILRLREKARERKEEKLFVFEGIRELQLAMKGGVEVKEIYYFPEYLQPEILNELKKNSGNAEWIEISRAVYEKIAVRESTEGIIAVAVMREHALGNLKLSNNPLILVVEQVEKPGNLGALLRTTDAAAVDAVIVCDTKVDFYNPNVIRSSLGCVFTQQTAVCTTEEAITFLKQNNICLFSATPDGAKNYTEVDFRIPCAIAVGSEAEGLSQAWLKNSDEKIVIPMRGEIDSLNVSVSAAVLIFESVRQRNPNTF